MDQEEGQRSEFVEDRKKREGKKKGRADSYFSTVATGLRGLLTIHSDCSQISVSHVVD